MLTWLKIECFQMVCTFVSIAVFMLVKVSISRARNRFWVTLMSNYNKTMSDALSKHFKD
jgi:hypothetical protein